MEESDKLYFCPHYQLNRTISQANQCECRRGNSCYSRPSPGQVLTDCRVASQRESEKREQNDPVPNREEWYHISQRNDSLVEYAGR